MSIDSSNPGAITSRQFLTIREAGAFIGVSTSTLRRRIQDRSLPSVQLGGKKKKHLIRPKDLLAVKAPNSGVAEPETSSPVLPVKAVTNVPDETPGLAAAQPRGRSRW